MFSNPRTNRMGHIPAALFLILFSAACTGATATLEPTPTAEPEPTNLPVAATPAFSKVEYDFEDGTTQGWGAHGDAAVTAATDAAHGGSGSLLVSERMDGGSGAAIDISSLLRPGTRFAIGGFVKLAQGEVPSQVILGIQRTPPGGNASYERFARSKSNAVTDAEWVELKGQYTYTGAGTSLILFFESPDEELADFYVDDVTISLVVEAEVQTDIPALRDVFADDFQMGAALPSSQLDEPDHAALLTRHFNILTLENEMKPGPIQPTEGDFRWSGPDKAVAFAKANGIAVHGHTLVWHSQGAGWMFLGQDGNPLPLTPESKALVLARMEAHIRAVVGRYKDAVTVWDVVNEVIDPAQPDCLRRSDFYKYTGADYLAAAFRAAYELDPDAALIINDYSTTEYAKRECLFRVTRDLLAQGVPVSGVGHQMHVNIASPTAAEIEETLTKFAELGIQQHITELDVSVYTNATDVYKTVPEDLLIRQGYYYKALFEVLRRHADQIATVTFWGLADDHTWLTSFPIVRPDLPLPFDQLLQAKPAYWGMVDPAKLPPLPGAAGATATVEPAALTFAAPGTPVIDGKLDAAWAAAEEISTGVWVTGSSGSTAKIKTLWDDSHLYVYAAVTDLTLSKASANPWEQDSIEVFIDQDNAKTNVYQPDDAQFRVNFENLQSFGGGVKTERIQSAAMIVEDGYVVELAIALDAVVPADGVRIGFDVQVNNDEDGDGVRDSIAVWHDPTGESYQNTSGLGTLEFRKAQ